MTAVAFVDADQGHPVARPDRKGWLGRDRNRLLLRREGWPAPIPDRRGRSARDAHSVRAARQMSELTLDKRMVVWGYSQGGHAALWTGIVAPRYAPDLEILGVAAIAPAANIKNILAMNVEVDKRFGPYPRYRTAGSTLTSHSSKRFGPRRSTLRVR